MPPLPPQTSCHRQLLACAGAGPAKSGLAQNPGPHHPHPEQLRSARPAAQGPSWRGRVATRWQRVLPACFLFCGLAWAPQVLANDAPALMLAKVYRPGLPLAGYWVSEKYDGVRGYWDGQRLYTRGGEPIHPPAWFTAGWPKHPMDGELWAGRGRFEQAVSVVRTQRPDSEAWRGIRYMVFDLPAHGGTFSQRVQAYQTAVKQIQQPWVQAVQQRQVANHAALMAQLDAMVQAGGEGLMLHRGDALHQAARSGDLLKVKTHEDGEAQVLAHLPGKGKYTGQLGALWVQMADGRRFRLGSGLSDAQRRKPPTIGSWVTFRYRGQHASGLPRFATFVRERSDHPDNAPPKAP